MRYTARRRSKKGNRVVAASIALMLGGGGLIATNSYASASEGWGPWPGERNEQQQSQTQSASPSASTIKCPEVANGLPEVPDGARAEVDRELATLDSQITEAYQRFADEKEQVERDPLFAQNAVLGPLKDKRAASIDRIAVAISRVTGQHPQRLESMAPCTLQVDDADEADTDGGNSQGQDQGRAQNGDGGQNNGNGNGEQGNGQQENGSGGEAGNGPEASTSSTSSPSSPPFRFPARSATPPAVPSRPTAA